MKTFHNIILIFLIANLVYADDRTNITFGDWLQQHGEYDRAINEYLKIIYSNTSESSVSQAILNITKCYLNNNGYEKGIIWANRNVAFVSSEYRDSLRILLGHCYLGVKQYSAAINSYEGLIVTDETVVKAEAYFWSGVASIHQLNIDDAKSRWKQISSESPYYPKVQVYMDLSDRLNRVNEKNPTLGAVLGAIPGLGYYYADYPQTGLSAAIVIGLMGWGTINLFKHNNNGFGILTGFITIGWYSGSVYGSYKAVQRANWNKYNAILNQISTNPTNPSEVANE